MNHLLETQVQTVSVGLLRHSMVSPRTKFNPQKLERLATSLKNTNGPLEPLTVRPHLENRLTVYEVVKGERRLRAALLAGITELPVEIRQLTDSEAKRLALIDTLERERLSDLEQVEAVMDLLCFEISLDAAGVQRVLNKMHFCQQKHKSLEPILDGCMGGAYLAEHVETIIKVFEEIGSTWRNYLTNALPLLELPSDVLEGLRNDVLPSKTIAKQIARIQCPNQRASLMGRLKIERWSSRILEAEINQLLGEVKPSLVYLERLGKICKQLEQHPVLPEQIEVGLQGLLTQLEFLLLPT